MQELISNVEHIRFELEIAVEQQLGAQPLPFPGMDKSGAAVCEFFLRASCGKGGMCPFRHISGEKTVVCKHWLRGLCKKGDQCEFLHEYDMTKMPECYFYSKFGSIVDFIGSRKCTKENVVIRNVHFYTLTLSPKSKTAPGMTEDFVNMVPCAGTDTHGESICVNYLVGFCPEGPSCKFMHPRFELPMGTGVDQPPLQQQQQILQKQSLTPFLQRSSSLVQIPSTNIIVGQQKSNTQSSGSVQQSQFQTLSNRGPRPLEQVTCYKCGEKGHYANRCTKGHLAFLSGQ